MTILEFRSEITATQKALSDFHLDFSNVRIVTPPFFKTRFVKIPVPMVAGSPIIVEMYQLGFWIPWELVVKEIIPFSLLVDVQAGSGPFQSWIHEHRFESSEGKTFLTDRITYELPFGILGVIADTLLMKSIQRRIFMYRHKKTKEYFLNR